jgi:hypothetical protein
VLTHCFPVSKRSHFPKPITPSLRWANEGE